MHTKYQNVKAINRRLLWDECRAYVPSLAMLPGRERFVMREKQDAHSPQESDPMDADGLPVSGTCPFGVNGKVGRWALGYRLAKGAMGAVYACHDNVAASTGHGGKRNLKPVIIKMIDKSKAMELKQLARLALEIELGKVLSHQNILGPDDAFVSDTHVSRGE